MAKSAGLKVSEKDRQIEMLELQLGMDRTFLLALVGFAVLFVLFASTMSITVRLFWVLILFSLLFLAAGMWKLKDYMETHYKLKDLVAKTKH